MGRQHDPVDQAPDQLRRLLSVVVLVERLDQPAHLARIHVRHRRVEDRRRFVGVLQFTFEHIHPGRDPLGVLAKHLRRHAALDRFDHPDPLTLEFCQFLAAAGCRVQAAPTQPVQVGGVLLAEDRRQLWVHQLALQRAENVFLEKAAADGQPVVAGPFVPGRRAADLIGVDQGAAATAAAAFDQIGKEILRAAGLHEPGLGLFVDCALLGLHRVPDRLIDDAQLWDLVDDPLAVGVELRDALAGLRVLHIAEPVPDHAPDIELVVQDSRAAVAVAVDRARPPVAPRGARDAVAVQLEGDLLW